MGTEEAAEEEEEDVEKEKSRKKNGQQLRLGTDERRRKRMTSVDETGSNATPGQEKTIPDRPGAKGKEPTNGTAKGSSRASS